MPANPGLTSGLPRVMPTLSAVWRACAPLEIKRAADRLASEDSERMPDLRAHLLDRIGVMALGKLLVGKI
jgi:hypothetical protein